MTELKTRLKLKQERRAEIDGEIKALEARIAEEAKPKLKHGDYWPVNDSYQIVLKRDADLEVFGDMSGCGKTPVCDTVDRRTGNFFDDLKALQEDVTELDIQCDCCNSKLTSERYKDGIELFIDEYSMKMSMASLRDLSMQIRQFIATLKREQAKK